MEEATSKKPLDHSKRGTNGFRLRPEMGWGRNHHYNGIGGNGLITAQHGDLTTTWKGGEGSAATCTIYRTRL